MPSLTSNRGKKKLPVNLYPTGEICIPVRVPADGEWIGMFLGAIHSLSLQIRYDRDPEHKAKVVADRWKEVYAQVEESLFTQEGCGSTPMPQTLVRQNSTNRCILEYSLNEGADWIPFANLKLCMPSIRRTSSGELKWYDEESFGFYRFPDGGYTPPSLYPEFGSGQPAEGTTDDEKRCNASYGAALALQALYRQTVQVFLDGAAMGALWIVQEMVDMIENLLVGYWLWDLAFDGVTDLLTHGADFTVDGFPDLEIENVQNYLYCRSSIDAESVVTFDYAGVIADFGGEAGSPYPGLNFLLQIALGEAGLNAAGSVRAGVGDCSEAPCNQTWEHTFDFSVNEQGFARLSQAVGGYWDPTLHLWRAAQNMVPLQPLIQLRIYADMPSETVITGYDIDWSCTELGTNGDAGLVSFFLNDVETYERAQYLNICNDRARAVTEVRDLNVQADEIWIGGDVMLANTGCGPVHGTFYVYSLTVYGTGPDPYA